MAKVKTPEKVPPKSPAMPVIPGWVPLLADLTKLPGLLAQSDLNNPPLAVSAGAKGLDIIKTAYKILDGIEAGIKASLRTLVEKSGEDVGEAGTRRFASEGWSVELRRTGGALDPDAVKRLLKKKGIDLNKAMVKEPPAYSVNPLTISRYLSDDELEKCKKAVKLALHVKAMKEDDENGQAD